MSISFNGTNIENVTYNGTQLDKVIYNGTTVWENWEEWSHTSDTPAWDSFPTSLSGSYTVPSDVIVTQVTVQASIINHAPDAGEARARGYANANNANILYTDWVTAPHWNVGTTSKSQAVNITGGTTIYYGLEQQDPRGWKCDVQLILTGKKKKS